MEIRLLRYFWAVAEEGNFSRAARVLNITQPTLSRQIKELEEMLNTQLFERGQREVSLTQDGLLLKERAEEILTLDTKLEETFSNRGGKLTGRLTIGCVEADNSDTLAMMLEELLADHPQVTFEILTGTGDEITDKLEKGLIDLALLLEPVHVKNVESLVLPREESWGFLVSKTDFAAQKEQITPTDISGMPVLISKRSEVQKLLADWGHIGYEELTIIGHFNLIFNVFSLVENQVGAAFTIKGAVANRLSSAVKFIPLDPVVKTNCLLVWKKRIHTPVVKEFISRCIHAFKA